MAYRSPSPNGNGPTRDTPGPRNSPNLGYVQDQWPRSRPPGPPVIRPQRPERPEETWEDVV